MDTSDKNPARLENFQAWQITRALAVRTYRLTQKPAFKEHAWLAESLRTCALDTPGNLARGHEMRRGQFEREFHYQLAKSECTRLFTLLAIATDLGLVAEADRAGLEENCESARRILGALVRATARDGEEEAEGDRPKPLRPSGSPGPGRRPPASGGGSRGGDPWDNRS